MTRWKQLHPANASGTRERINDVAVADGALWTVSNAGLVRRTPIDGGQTTCQVIAPGATAHHLRCIEYLPDGSAGWIGALRFKNRTLPRLLRSTNGSSWQPVPNLPDDPADGICGLRFAGQDLLFAIGTYNKATAPAVWRCRIKDAPDTWTLLPMSAPGLQLTHLSDMHFFDQAHGLAVGGSLHKDALYRPAVLRTTDAGDSWSAVKLPDLGPTAKKTPPRGRYAWKVFFLSERIGFVSISSYEATLDPLGFILKTTDGGASWTVLEIDRVEAGVVNVNLRGVGFLDEDHGFCCGHEAPLVETVDGGASWHPSTLEINDANRFKTVDGAMHLAGNGLYRAS